MNKRDELYKRFNREFAEKDERRYLFGGRPPYLSPTEKLHMARRCLIWTLNRVAYKKSGYFDVELERTREALARPGKVIRYESS